MTSESGKQSELRKVLVPARIGLSVRCRFLPAAIRWHRLRIVNSLRDRYSRTLKMVLSHETVKRYGHETLRGSTMFTSAGPCAMCADAIFWSGVGQLVFRMSGKKLHFLGEMSPDMLVASSGDVLAQAGRKVEVVGPILEEEAIALSADGVHWSDIAAAQLFPNPC